MRPLRDLVRNKSTDYTKSCGEMYFKVSMVLVMGIPP